MLPIIERLLDGIGTSALTAVVGRPASAAEVARDEPATNLQRS